MLDQTQAHTVDLTGGAPELNPNFRYLVDECAARGKHVIDRCNLTVLLIPRNADLPHYLAERRVEVVCSLPHFKRRNTDAQRGEGTFEKSIEALRRLNAAGYGHGETERLLTLMVNPVGALLTGDQCSMEREWKRGLERNHGVTFDRLIAINNMPIARFLEWLETSGNLQSYMELLVNSYNPATVDGLMCRNTLSVSWDGRVFDCDFNQMLDLESSVGMGDRCGSRILTRLNSRAEKSSPAATVSAAPPALAPPAEARSTTPRSRPPQSGHRGRKHEDTKASQSGPPTHRRKPQITQMNADEIPDGAVPRMDGGTVGDLAIADHRLEAHQLRTPASVVAMLPTGRRARGASIPPRPSPVWKGRHRIYTNRR